MADAHGEDLCPVARGSEIIATRWTPLIIRNMLVGASTFSEIRALTPAMPRSVLTERLRQLERVGVIERRQKPTGRGWLYELTATGRDLQPVCEAIGVWGRKWLEVAPQKGDPHVLLWTVCKAMDAERIPEERVVVRVAFRDAPKHQFWLLVQRPEPEVCIKHPGFDEDLVVTSDIASLGKWYMGDLSLGQGMHAGLITIEGPRDLVREFATWGGVSQFASVAPAYTAGADN